MGPCDRPLSDVLGFDGRMGRLGERWSWGPSKKLAGSLHVRNVRGCSEGSIWMVPAYPKEFPYPILFAAPPLGPSKTVDHGGYEVKWLGLQPGSNPNTQA